MAARVAARVPGLVRDSSSRVRTLTATISGTATVAPTAGMAVPESLIAKPMVSVMASATSPGRSVGARSNERWRAREPHDVGRART